MWLFQTIVDGRMPEGHTRRKDQIDRELELGKEFTFQKLNESYNIQSLVSSLPHNASTTSQHHSRTKVLIYGGWRTYPDYIHNIALKMIKLLHIKSNQTLLVYLTVKVPGKAAECCSYVYHSQDTDGVRS